MRVVTLVPLLAIWTTAPFPFVARGVIAIVIGALGLLAFWTSLGAAALAGCGAGLAMIGRLGRFHLELRRKFRVFQLKIIAQDGFLFTQLDLSDVLPFVFSVDIVFGLEVLSYFARSLGTFL